MKKVIQFLTGLLFITLVGTSMGYGQIIIAQDDASDDTYSDGWTTGDNGGFGFGEWVIVTNDGGGVFIEDTGINGTDSSFGIYSAYNNDVAAVATRYLSRPLDTYQTLKFTFGHTLVWGGGEVGFSLFSEDEYRLNFKIGYTDPGAEYFLHHGGDDIATGIFNDNNDQTLVVELTKLLGNNYTLKISSEGNEFIAENYTALTGNLSINRIDFYSKKQGVNQNVGVNNLKVTGGTTNLNNNPGFRMFSSPVEVTYAEFLEPVWTQGAAGADVTSGDPNIFTWDNTSTTSDASNWTGLTDLTGTITAGTGFLAAVYEDDNYSEEGGTGWPKTLSVSGTENAAGVSPTVNPNANGWTLVGNPFASTIDFDLVTSEDLTGSIYIWDATEENGIEPNEGENPGAGSWKTYAVGDGSLSGPGDITNGLIAPFQGFFIQNSSSLSGTPSITFGEASKSSGGTFYGKANEGERAVVRMELQGEGLGNSMWIQFSENGSFSNQVKGDALELSPLSSSYAQLAIKKDDTLYDIAHLPVNNSQYEVPVDILATSGGTFTLKATDFEIPSTMELYFHDYETGSQLLIHPEFETEVTVPAAKVQDVPPLKRLQSAPMKAKGTSSNRYAISVRPKTGVYNEPAQKPLQFELSQNYPNPFNPSTNIEFSLAEAGRVNLDVFNIMGQKVASLVNEVKSAGTYQVSWQAENMPSGMYYYRLKAAGNTITRKMTLIK